MARLRRSPRPEVIVQMPHRPELVVRVSAHPSTIPDRVFEMSEVDEAVSAAQQLVREIGATVRFAN